MKASTTQSALDYVCPRCKGPLQIFAERYACGACDRDYPVVLGIPDFRLRADPYIGFYEDREKAAQLVRYSELADLRGLVEYYWSITPDTPAEMARRFTAQALAGAQRGRHLLSSLTPGLPEARQRFIELGCRSGGVLAAAADHYEHLVGIDIALRWLVIARKCLLEAGIPAQLVCCCAGHLPFADGSFDLAIAENVLEHAATPQEVIDEAYRVLEPGGVLFATTWNRFALAPEPHVRLWGVGWMPRALARRFVRKMRGTSYDHVRLLSVFEVQRLLRRSPFRNGQLGLPTFSQVEVASRSSFEQRLVGLYHNLKDWPLIRAVLLLVGPVLQIRCVAAQR
jgi:SAM-dependent methyltransferase